MGGINCPVHELALPAPGAALKFTRFQKGREGIGVQNLLRAMNVRVHATWPCIPALGELHKTLNSLPQTLNPKLPLPL